jgi:uncharacterized protein
MDRVRLGKTEITVGKNGFGVLPLQRAATGEAVRILRRALDGGIDLYDTARWYTDSEEKIGLAFEGFRNRIYIATKTGAQTAQGFWQDLELSLRMLKTDYIDLYQFHNPPFCPVPDGTDGLYAAMLSAKRQGKIRHIGLTNHRLSVAREAVESGLYETLQFPFSYLATQADLDLVHACADADMGFLAMKALSGGLITNAKAAYAYIAQYANVLPIWGIQRESELDEFLSFREHPPRMDDAAAALIARDRKALSGSFCRGCGYCMPCPAGIEIHTFARISLLLRRSPTAQWFSAENQAKMNRVADCLDCGQCEARCPYGLKTRELLRENYKDYREVLAAGQRGEKR